MKRKPSQSTRAMPPRPPKGGWHPETHGQPGKRVGTLFGHAVSAACKALGQAGYSTAEVELIFKSLGTGTPRRSTIATAVGDGRNPKYNRNAANLTPADFAAADRACGRKPNANTNEGKDNKVARILESLHLPSMIVDDIKEIERSGRKTTTKKALIDARLGQGKFRTEVLKLWDSCCAVTGSMTLEAIRASHIKPWRESTDQQRLDPHNGLPLVASLDALFDAGLISFDENGTLLVSPQLTAAERRIFGLKGKNLTRRPSAKAAEHLAYHYSRRFKQ